MSQKQKRKLWKEESMGEAIKYVQKGKSLREASRLYNVPVETLRRRANGSVDVSCKPGPSTILTKEEEKCLLEYVVEMADRGFGLSSDDLRRVAFTIAERSGRPHPFHSGMAGRGWLDAFRHRHPQLSLRIPQALSYCRASMASKNKIDDFFAKLGALYGRLNLISKPMQVYNIDETGITVVHKPGKVFSVVGRKHVYSLTSAEKGKTHTVVACVSASGNSIPPLMIYPRKKAVPEGMKIGAVPGTIFMNSDNGWITQDIYLEWFKFFIKTIPPARPVLLIEDGHGSHITLDVIELARKNNIHLLCLPAHTSHILQPLDIGVFHSFKTLYSKACRKYIAKNPGRVITSEAIASLVGDTWPQSVTPINILSGFKKSGISPLNPSEVSDRMLAPAKGLKSNNSKSPPTYSAEEIALYEKRFIEGYDLCDSRYEQWLKENHPESSDADSMKTHVSRSISTASSNESSLLSDILKYPESKTSSKAKRKPAINTNAVCLSDSPVVRHLKEEEEEKREAEKEKLRKKEERERKKLLKAKEKEEKRLQKTERRMVRKADDELSENEDDIECPICCIKGLGCQWICCDNCDTWYHTHCTDVDPDNVPNIFFCTSCV